MANIDSIYRLGDISLHHYRAVLAKVCSVWFSLLWLVDDSEKQRKNAVGRRRTTCDVWRTASRCWRTRTRRWSANSSHWRSCTARKSRLRASVLLGLLPTHRCGGLDLHVVIDRPVTAVVCEWSILAALRHGPRYIAWTVHVERPLLQLLCHILAWSCLLSRQIFSRNLSCFVRYRRTIRCQCNAL